MQFGKSLAKLATDIAAGYGERNEIAVARATSLAALNAATQQTLTDNNVHRAGVARDLAATAADLRQRLAASDAALGAAVQDTLMAARQDLAAKRQTISDNARALLAREPRCIAAEGLRRPERLPHRSARRSGRHRRGTDRVARQVRLGHAQ